MSIINWIELWRKKYCDRDWESENGFKIEATSNPGWSIEIDLKETVLESVEYNSNLVDNSSEYFDEESSMVLTNHDWYFVKIENGVFKSAGDNNKLFFMLNEFRRLCIENGEVSDR